MKDKLNRAKARIQEHRTKIAFSSGVLVGAGGILYVVGRANSLPVPFEITLAASEESLRQLIANPKGAIEWTHTTGSVIQVINEANPTLK
jgi:hypothetical protein